MSKTKMLKRKNEKKTIITIDDDIPINRGIIDLEDAKKRIIILAKLLKQCNEKSTKILGHYTDDVIDLEDAKKRIIILSKLLKLCNDEKSTKKLGPYTIDLTHDVIDVDEMDEVDTYKKTVLGDTLYNSCKTSNKIPYTQFLNRAFFSNIPPFKLLHMCKMFEVVVEPFNLIMAVDKVNEAYNNRKRMLYPKPVGEATVEGGYGEVTIRSNAITKKKYAVKYITNKPDYNELDVLTRFNHPNILRAFDFYFTADRDPKAYDKNTSSKLEIVMPLAYCDMDNFYDFENGKIDKATLTEEVKVKFMVELISAMAFLQSQGFFHCDLKPANVLMFWDSPLASTPDTIKDAGNYKAVLADMNFCYPFTFGYMGNGYLKPCGTPSYRSYEQEIFAFENTYPKVDPNTIADQLSSDMFLLGQVCLFISNRPTIDTRQITSKNVKRYLNDIFTEERLISKNIAPNFAKFLVAMLGERELRPKEYIQLLDFDYFKASNNTLIVGSVVYKNIVGPNLDDIEQQLKTQVGHIINYFIRIPDDEYNNFRYETIFTAIQLLYRFLSKKPELATDENVTDACISLALDLSFLWKGKIIRFDPDADSYEINNIKRVIALHLNGQLRFPYIMEMVSNDQEIINLFREAKTNPRNFVDILLRPVEYFKHVTSYQGNDLVARREHMPSKKLLKSI
jgi:serine/threonine protein kinase